MYYSYKSIKSYTDDDYKSFIKSLPISDQQKCNLKINNEKKYQAILGRIILKDILKTKYNISYNDVKVKFNINDKPYIDGINFNISHSYDYVVVAVADDAIGVDIEKIRKIDLSIMKQFCTHNEQKYIMNSNNKYLSFWKIYTLKEAYFKMLGTNLFDMKSVEFSFLDNQIICSNNNKLNILLSEEIDNYILSIIYK